MDDTYWIQWMSKIAENKNHLIFSFWKLTQQVQMKKQLLLEKRDKVSSGSFLVIPIQKPISPLNSSSSKTPSYSHIKIDQVTPEIALWIIDYENDTQS